MTIWCPHLIHRCIVDGLTTLCMDEKKKKNSFLEFSHYCGNKSHSVSESVNQSDVVKHAFRSSFHIQFLRFDCDCVRPCCCVR